MPSTPEAGVVVICSDSLEFAAEVLAEGSDAHSGLAPARGDGTMPLATALLGGRHYVHVGAAPFPAWSLLVLTADAAQSQFDQLIALSRNGHDLPDRTACLARTGTRFHGYKGRPWSAAPGNIHLTVHFAPRCAIERFEVAFTILAALSVVDAIDEVPGLRHRPGIRWINDVVVGDAKLGGVLAYTQTRGQTVTSAVLGIGVNVETTPAVEPTPFVPAVSSIGDLVADGSSPSLRTLLDVLLGALQRNYDLLLQAGYRPLLERYRERSTVIGRECTICTEESDREPEVIATGRVVAVGEGLELHLDGCDLPMTRGRLLLGRPQAFAGAGGYAVCPMPGPAGSRSNAGSRGEHGARRRN